MKRIVYILFVLFLLSDIVFSFIQHFHVSLDGDMSSIVLPSKAYQTVLDDPFGMSVLFNDSVYPAPNRFFAHWFMSGYFKKVPVLLQHIVNPIDSVYLSCAIAKTGIQFLIIFLLAAYISGKSNLLNRDFLLAAVLITPLFQTFGYNGQMGIIDHSITYTFFYAFSISIVLLFFLPFFNTAFHKRESRFNFISISLWVLLAVILSFNGPLNPAVILIICPFVILNKWRLNFRKHPGLPFLKRIFTAFRNIPGPLTFIFILVSVLCMYSLYIGMNNAENFWQSVPLLERYARLPIGLYNQFTQKLGPPVLLLMIIINILIINNKKQHIKNEELLRLLKWIGIFAVVYIILLPLGGYRDYRPDIIRRDTFMPVFLSMIFFYGISSLYIIKNIRIGKNIYYAGILIFTLIFVHADAVILNHNECERNALEKIANSSDNIIILEDECSVMSWGKIKDYHDAEINSELLLYWGVIKEKKLYQHK